MKVELDASISSGLVERPYPAGDVLGSREGEFYFYVLPAAAPQLELQPMPGQLRPAEQPVAFRLVRPAGLTAVEMHYTVTMPGFILEEGTSASLDYVYDAQRLAASFPNLDLRSQGQIKTSDVVTFTFFVSGTDASGVRRHFARQVVLNGEELLMPEQRPVAATGRRRVAR